MPTGSPPARFFVQNVGDWVRSRFGVAFPPESTAVGGVSAGAELSLALGIRHPGIYTQEPFFRENATRWADALRAAGADIVLPEHAGDHGDPFWHEEFPLMVT